MGLNTRTDPYSSTCEPAQQVAQLSGTQNKLQLFAISITAVRWEWVGVCYVEGA